MRIGQGVDRNCRIAGIWELSRFAAVDLNTFSSLTHQASAKHAAGLFRRVAQVARKSGARMLITVSPVGMERLLRANGFRSMRDDIDGVL
jgi:N-acyl-L-homoserine lactone synthetase